MSKAKKIEVIKAEVIDQKKQREAALISSLSEKLSVKEDDIIRLQSLEHELRRLKSEKLNREQKVIRAKMRNRKFYRSELSDEILSDFNELYVSLHVNN